MRSGKLDSTILIEAPSSGGVDAYGAPATSFMPLASIRAEIVQATTSEFIRGVGAEAEALVVFRVRYRSDVTTHCRITYRGQIYNIKEIVEIGRRRGLEIRAEKLGIS